MIAIILFVVSPLVFAGLLLLLYRKRYSDVADNEYEEDDGETDEDIFYINKGK